MRRAAIFVSPARYEPFGLTVLEAAQAGCALVLSDIATFREIWNGAALFVGPDDADAMAAVLNRLIADPRLRSRLSAAARKRARRYSAQRMAQNTARVYRELLSSRPCSVDALHDLEEAAA
jgi:glycosyltransferase involved in cell wall biosynthesis